MKQNCEIGIRSFSRNLNDREKKFYEISDSLNLDIIWPDKCVNCQEIATRSYSISAEKNQDFVMMGVPLCQKHFACREKSYSWVPNSAIWIVYTGIIILFVVLYFAFSFTGKDSLPSELLLSTGIISAMTILGGAFLPTVARLFSQKYRAWDEVPGVKMKLLNTNPYFKDLLFSFSNSEYFDEFSLLNNDLGIEMHEQKINEKLIIQRRAIEKDSSNAEAYFMFGLGLERSGRFKEAIEKFLKALELKGSYPRASRHLGACYLIDSKPGQAEDALKNALSQEPENLDTLLLLSALYQNLRKFDQAEGLLKQVLESHPGDPELHCKMAEFLVHTAQHKKAEDEFGKALLLNEEHRSSLGGLALLYLETKEVSKFTDIVKKIRLLDPELASRLAQIATKTV